MNRIREVREAADILQVSLYSELSWPQSRISNYENGRRKPGLAECRLIVDALNKLGARCTLDQVFPAEPKKAVA